MRPAIVVENTEEDSNHVACGDDTLFMNAYAFLSDSMNESMSVTHTTESVKGDGERGERSKVDLDADSDETTSHGGSPVKKCRSDSSVVSRISLHHRSAGRHGDSISLNGESMASSHSDVVELSPAQVAGVWKELTLNRLLQLVELETLEGVLAYDAVDGKNIAKNFGPLKIRRARASSTAASTRSGSGKSRSVRGRRGGGCGHSEVGGVTRSGVGSTHPNWLNRRFGSRLSRVQPVPSPPPAMNVHTSLYRSRSNNKLNPSSSSTISPSSSMMSLTLHHKLRYSIKNHSSGGSERTTTTAYLPPKSLSSSSPCLAAAAAEKKEGGRGE